MEAFFKYLAANPFLLLFLTVGLAVWVGKFSVKGYGLGMVAAAIVVGGALATWAGSEAVLASYLLGMILAGTVGRDHALIRRLRTLCFGLLTPFFFIRAGALVSLPALVAAPGAFLLMLATKVLAKTAGVYPITRLFRSPRTEGLYTSLLMSTGLTFGTISALFGFTHNVVDQAQFSVLVAAVIASAVVPTLIANAWLLPRHHMPAQETKTD